MRKLTPYFILALLWSLASQAQSISENSLAESSFVAIRWANMHLNLIRTTDGFTPPVAARALAYSGITMYESVVHSSPIHRSLATQLNGLSSYTLPKPLPNQLYVWTVVANAAQAQILRNLYIHTSWQNKQTIDSLENALYAEIKNPEVNLTDFDASVFFGRKIANAIFEWSKTDGGHGGYLQNQPSNYTPPQGLGLWSPTKKGDAGRAVQPSWGRNRPFLVANSYLSIPPPIAFSADSLSAFYQQSKEVYETGIALSEQQREIANFWADGSGSITPPGHFINIATIAIINNQATLLDAAEIYAKVGIAVGDAFICCWKCKYMYNVLRPVSYIQKYISPKWLPLLETPSFPEYLSGHATQSGAAAEVLSTFFGDNYQFVDNTHPKVAQRTYNSFAEAAHEAANSRLYGGIHYRSANENGIFTGQLIGRNVNRLKTRN